MSSKKGKIPSAITSINATKITLVHKQNSARERRSSCHSLSSLRMTSVERDMADLCDDDGNDFEEFENFSKYDKERWIKSVPKPKVDAQKTANSAKKEFEDALLIKKNEAAIYLQSIFRGYLIRKAFQGLRHDVILCQCLVRRWIAIRKYNKIKLEKRLLIKRSLAIEEFYNTECSYVSQLDSVCKVYIKPMRAIFQEKKSGIGKQAIEDIFGNIEKIYNSHLDFISILKPVIPQFLNLREEYYFSTYAFHLISLIPAYFSFAANYTHSQNVLAKCKKVEAFSSFLGTAESIKLFKRLDLSSCLIAPIQRIPRYVLLIKEIAKNTAEGHPDFLLLRKALSVLQSYATKINQLIQNNEDNLESDSCSPIFFMEKEDSPANDELDIVAYKESSITTKEAFLIPVHLLLYQNEFFLTEYVISTSIPSTKEQFPCNFFKTIAVKNILNIDAGLTNQKEESLQESPYSGTKEEAPRKLPGFSLIAQVSPKKEKFDEKDKAGENGPKNSDDDIKLFITPSKIRHRQKSFSSLNRLEEKIEEARTSFSGGTRKNLKNYFGDLNVSYKNKPTPLVNISKLRDTQETLRHRIRSSPVLSSGLRSFNTIPFSKELFRYMIVINERAASMEQLRIGSQLEIKLYFSNFKRYLSWKSYLIQAFKSKEDMPPPNLLQKRKSSFRNAIEFARLVFPENEKEGSVVNKTKEPTLEMVEDNKSTSQSMLDKMLSNRIFRSKSDLRHHVSSQAKEDLHISKAPDSAPPGIKVPVAHGVPTFLVPISRNSQNQAIPQNLSRVLSESEPDE